MIDWTLVDRLRADLGEADFREIVDMSIEELDSVLLRIADAATAAERESNLHFLKGGALTLGMNTLAEACRDAELRARAGEETHAESGRIAGLYAESRASLEQGLRDRADD